MRVAPQQQVKPISVVFDSPIDARRLDAIGIVHHMHRTGRASRIGRHQINRAIRAATIGHDHAAPVRILQQRIAQKTVEAINNVLGFIQRRDHKQDAQRLRPVGDVTRTNLACLPALLHALIGLQSVNNLSSGSEDAGTD